MICEICNHEIGQGGESEVQTGRLLAALRMGYEPLRGIGPERPIEHLRENLWVLLEMHEPVWILCSSCCDLVNSYADKEVKHGPRPPELIHIFGNGFQPEPWQWRVLMGAWVDKWEKKGVEITIVGTPIGIEECPKGPLGDFIEAIDKLLERYRGRLVDSLVMQNRGSELVLLAVWSVEDSPAMRTILGKS